MTLRAILLALTFAGVTLTGCLGGGGEEPAPTATTDGENTLNTTAPDNRGRIVAFEEVNQTEAGAGGVDHHHDHWQGRSRVVMFEKTDIMDPFPWTDGTYAVFRPPQGTLVYEGTASVEFTLSNPRRHACEPAFTVNARYVCTDDPVYVSQGVPPVADPAGGPTGLKMRYKHASTVEWIDAGDVVWGVPTIIQITHPTQTDMPHVTSSAWEFMIVSPNPQDVTLMFDAKAEIVRATGAEIPLWPGHPLFYTEERPSRVVIDNVEAMACDDGFAGTSCVLADGESLLIVPDKLVSYGTRTLYVWINISDFQAPNPALAPHSFFLFHNNASGRENVTNTVDATNYGIDKRELAWVLPVDDGGMDSPYADGSKWAFQLGASYVPPAENPLISSCYDNCAEWSAKYTITVIASAIELPADQYHMYCLEDTVHCPQPGSSEGDGGQRRLVTGEEMRARGWA